MGSQPHSIQVWSCIPYSLLSGFVRTSLKRCGCGSTLSLYNTSVGATRKINILMKQIEDYVAPAAEVIEVIEEKSFCSDGNLVDKDENKGNIGGMPWG